MNFDLACDLRRGAHHSGNWGGILANPGIILAHALASITTAKGRILVDGWRPDSMPDSVRRALAGVERDGGAEAPRTDPDWGEPGLTEAEKVFGWNSFEVLAFRTGDPERPVNAIPPRATASCQIRYVAGSRPEGFLSALRRHLDEGGFSAVEVGPPPAGNAGALPGSRTDPESPWAAWVAASIERTTGAAPAVLPNSAGSICNYVFEATLGLPTIWIPHSYAGCSQHAPDEHLLKGTTREALAITTGVYWDLGERPPGVET